MLFLPRLKLRKYTVLGPSAGRGRRTGSPSPGRLDLDHFGAVIRERPGEVGPGQEDGKVDDPQAGKLHR
jgi:hypothetical protein